MKRINDHPVRVNRSIETVWPTFSRFFLHFHWLFLFKKCIFNKKIQVSLDLSVGRDFEAKLLPEKFARNEKPDRPIRKLRKCLLKDCNFCSNSFPRYRFVVFCCEIVFEQMREDLGKSWMRLFPRSADSPTRRNELLKLQKVTR